MNNKGFIATSLVYSFFIVFVAVMASVLATYAHNRILVNNVNDGIIDDLNETVENKYLVIENMLRNSDFEEENRDLEGNNIWNITGNASITVVPDPLPDPLPDDFKIISYRGMKSLDIRIGVSEIRQSIHKILDEEEEETGSEGNPYDLKKDHYYYFRYYIFRNGTARGSSNFTLEGPANYNFNLDYVNVNDEIYANWDLMSNIILVGKDGSYTLKIASSINNESDFANLNIDSLMFIDATELINAGQSIPDAIKYLDTFDYFEGKKSIPKP